MNYKTAEDLGLIEELPEFLQVPEAKVFTPNEIAEMVGVSGWTVRRWCIKGEISCYKGPSGRYLIRGKDYMEFLQMCKIKCSLGW